MKIYILLLILLQFFILANEDRVNAYLNELKKAKHLVNRFKEAYKNNSKDIDKIILEIQANPSAIKELNSQEDIKLKKVFNKKIKTLHDKTLINFKDKFVKHYNNLHPNNQITAKDIEFKEFTNPSKVVKVGHDWDVTVTIKGKEVNYKEVKNILHDSFYEAVGGKKNYPNLTSEEFAHKYKVEVTSSHHAEAYEGGIKYIKNPDSYDIKDPQRLSKTIKHKSDLELKNINNLSTGELEVAKEEQIRQFIKQYDKHIKPRVQKFGGNIPNDVEEGVKIFRKVGKFDAKLNRIYTPSDAQKALRNIGMNGNNIETIINKGSSLVESAHKLKPNLLNNKPKIKKTKLTKMGNIAGSAVAGVVIFNTADSIKKYAEGKKSLKDVSKDIGNLATGGAIATVEETYQKNKAFKDTLKLRDKAQSAQDEYIIQKSVLELVDNGVSLKKAKLILQDMQKGDNRAYIKELKRLRKEGKNVGLWVKKYIDLQNPDDTASQRAKKLAIDIANSSVESIKSAGKFVVQTGEDVTKIATTGYLINKVTQDAKKNKDETAKIIKDKLLQEGMGENAVDIVVDAFKKGDTNLLKKVTKHIKKDKLSSNLKNRLNRYIIYVDKIRHTQNSSKEEKELAINIFKDIKTIQKCISLAEQLDSKELSNITTSYEKERAWNRCQDKMYKLDSKIDRLSNLVKYAKLKVTIIDKVTKQRLKSDVQMRIKCGSKKGTTRGKGEIIITHLPKGECSFSLYSLEYEFSGIRYFRVNPSKKRYYHFVIELMPKNSKKEANSNCSLLRFKLNLSPNYSCCKDDLEKMLAQSMCDDVERRLASRVLNITLKMKRWIANQEGGRLKNGIDYSNYQTPWGSINNLQKCRIKIRDEYCKRLGVPIKNSNSNNNINSKKAQQCYEEHRKFIENARKQNASQDPSGNIIVFTETKNKECKQQLKACEDKVWAKSDYCRNKTSIPQKKCNFMHQKGMIRCAQENIDCAQRFWKRKCGIK